MGFHQYDATQKVKTTYEVTVTNGADSNHKTLTVTARTFSPTSATTPKVTRKYDMDIQAVTAGGSGPSSVVSGVGGLTLNNNAKIQLYTENPTGQTQNQRFYLDKVGTGTEGESFFTIKNVVLHIWWVIYHD